MQMSKRAEVQIHDAYKIIPSHIARGPSCYGKEICELVVK
jgi:hypothetical protein